MWEWVLKHILEEITLGEYNRIKVQNKLGREYRTFVELLQKVANKRLVTCKGDELSNECPMMFVIGHYFQQPRSTSYGTAGTAPLRIYTLMGVDGQIINIQCFDLSETVKITVRHRNGMTMEDIDPGEALKRIRREAVLY